MDQFSCEHRQSFELIFRVTALDKNIFPFNPSRVPQSIEKRNPKRCVLIGSDACDELAARAEYAYRVFFSGLLRTRRERPSRRSTAEQCDELTPSHAEHGLSLSSRSHVTCNWSGRQDRGAKS